MYSKLYLPEDIDLTLYLHDNLPLLSDDEIAFMESPFTIDEFDKAVKSLSKKSSPGLDGLSTEFYTHFCQQIRSSLFDVFQHSLVSGELSLSMRKGVITLIPKSGDPLDIKIGDLFHC